MRSLLVGYILFIWNPRNTVRIKWRCSGRRWLRRGRQSRYCGLASLERNVVFAPLFAGIHRICIWSGGRCNNGGGLRRRRQNRRGGVSTVKRNVVFAAFNGGIYRLAVRRQYWYSNRFRSRTIIPGEAARKRNPARNKYMKPANEVGGDMIFLIERQQPSNRC